MKSAVLLLALLVSVNGFNQPLLATRAIGAKKSATKVVAKKSATKKVAPAAKPAAKAPSLTLPSFSFGGAKSAAPVAAPVAAKKAAPKAVAKKAAPKAVAKKAVAKPNPFAKKAAPKKAAPVMKKTTRAPTPASKGYPSIADKAGAIKFKGISGTGLFPAPMGGIPQPDFSDPKLQKTRDPAFYAAAAAQRAAKLRVQDYDYDDGLTVLERKQRGSMDAFLTGSAKSQADRSAIVGEIDAPAFGGLSADRFQLLFISVFGLFTLVGSLANAKPYV